MTDIRSSIKQDTLKDLESYLCFRRALRREDQRVLDNLYQKASLNFVAAQSVDHALPFEILLLSMLLEEHNKVKRHRHQVDEVLHETKAGKRQLKLGEASMAQLAAQRERQQVAKAAAGDRWQENDLIFPTTIGTPSGQPPCHA